jgi:hypothetical protein
MFNHMLDDNVFLNVEKIKYNAVKLIDELTEASQTPSSNSYEGDPDIKKKKTSKKRVHRFQKEGVEGSEAEVNDSAKLKIEELVHQQFVVTTDQMILQSFEEASATPVTLNDRCWICNESWSEFVDLRLVTVLPCSHSACSNCLFNLLKSCNQKQNDELTLREYNFQFSCGICRLELDETIPYKTADQVLNTNQISSFYQFISSGRSKNDRRERRQLISYLLVDRFEYDVGLVEAALFNLIDIIGVEGSDKLTTG